MTLVPILAAMSMPAIAGLMAMCLVYMVTFVMQVDADRRDRLAQSIAMTTAFAVSGCAFVALAIVGGLGVS